MKIAYKLLLNNSRTEIGESSNEQSLSPLWKNLWKLKLPLKIKVFAWYPSRDGLPTFQNLSKKQVQVDNKYPIYQQPNESSSHAIFECGVVQLNWNINFLNLYLFSH